jgi:Ca-activated chloride channel homolog
MTRRKAILLAAAVGAIAAAQEPTFRVDVKLVRILATVKNGSGELVGNLDRGDFVVFDNGVRQTLSLFEHHTEQPLSIAVLIDTSASTGIDIRYETESTSRFLAALFNEGNPEDRAALYSFSWETVQRTGFTRRAEVFDRELKRLKSEGGTSLYDALYFASQALEDRQGRHAIVVVTDGGDTTSAKDFHAALEAAHMADAVIYPILVVPITNDAGRNVGGENALTLLARGTGGRVSIPALGKELDAAFDSIIRELRTQYLLGYYPKDVPPSKDRFHRIELSLRRPELRVLARSGYYGESEQARGWTPVR